MAHEHAATVKLPPFWTTQPRSWFAQAEAQFIIREFVNDDTKVLLHPCLTGPRHCSQTPGPRHCSQTPGPFGKPTCQRHSKNIQAHIHIPDRKFDHIHVDIVGPLPPSQGFQYLFTVVDRTTRWAEAFSLKDTTAESCIQTLMGWISRFGIPSHITSDRGSKFTSRLWLGIAKSLGYTLHHTTTYHPQTNGMIEKFHTNLKEALNARILDNGWVLYLGLY